jgi:hypothetical protein
MIINCEVLQRKRAWFDLQYYRTTWLEVLSKSIHKASQKIVWTKITSRGSKPGLPLSPSFLWTELAHVRKVIPNSI